MMHVCVGLVVLVGGKQPLPLIGCAAGFGLVWLGCYRVATEFAKLKPWHFYEHQHITIISPHQYCDGSTNYDEVAGEFSVCFHKDGTMSFSLDSEDGIACNESALLKAAKSLQHLAHRHHAEHP